MANSADRVIKFSSLGESSSESGGPSPHRLPLRDADVRVPHCKLRRRSLVRAHHYAFIRLSPLNSTDFAITFCAGVGTYAHPTTSTAKVVDLMGPSAEADKDLVSCLRHVSFTEASFLLLY
jgi:hypothetical protein